MPRGPRGENRPADVVDEDTEELARSARSAAVTLGARGGKARAARMTPERRTEIARKAAAKRWQK